MKSLDILANDIQEEPTPEPNALGMVVELSAQMTKAMETMTAIMTAMASEQTEVEEETVEEETVEEETTEEDTEE